MSDTAGAVDARLFWEPERARPGEPLQLAVSRCLECGRCEFIARDYCPGCNGVTELAPLSSEATLAGFTAVLHQPPDSVVEAPYVVGVAQFREGLSILGLVNGIAIDDLAVGQHVRTVGFPVGDAVGFAFEPTVP